MTSIIDSTRARLMARFPSIGKPLSLEEWETELSLAFGTELDRASTGIVKAVANDAPLTPTIASATGLGESEWHEVVERAYLERAQVLTPGPEISGHRELFSNIMRIVMQPDRLGNIPTAECLHGRLPSDRKPTREELEAAWDECANAQEREGH